MLNCIILNWSLLREQSSSYGIRSQLLPLNGRTRYGYTYTQNSSPIYWGVKLTNHVGLLLLMPVSKLSGNVKLVEISGNFRYLTAN